MQNPDQSMSSGSTGPYSFKNLSDYLQGLIRARMWAQVLVGMTAGIVVGIMIGPGVGWVEPANASAISDWIALPGKLFLALIQMIVIPLVFASIILGLTATEDMEQLRKMGLRVMLYFIATTVLAIIIGMLLAFLIKPGNFVDSTALQTPLATGSGAETTTAGSLGIDELPQKLLSILPTNPLSSMVESNMLQVVIFAIVVGVSLVMMNPKQSRPMLELLGSLQEVCMTVVKWAMWLAPYAVFGLIAQLTAKLGLDALLGMTVYVATVIAGLLVLLLVYLCIILVIDRRNPLQFLVTVRDVLLLAFSTSSSAAVIPLSIKTAEEKLNVRSSISQFVIPLGATINMNGTALYQGVATIFLAQIYNIDISTGGLALIVVTAVGASIGAPGTPGVGIVILSMVLASAG